MQRNVGPQERSISSWGGGVEADLDPCWESGFGGVALLFCSPGSSATAVRPACTMSRTGVSGRVSDWSGGWGLLPSANSPGDPTVALPQGWEASIVSGLFSISASSASKSVLDIADDNGDGGVDAVTPPMSVSAGADVAGVVTPSGMFVSWSTSGGANNSSEGDDTADGGARTDASSFSGSSRDCSSRSR